MRGLIFLSGRAKKLRFHSIQKVQKKNIAFWSNPILYTHSKKRFNVIILLEDALRGDHISCYGYYRNKKSFLLYLKVGLLSLCFGFFIEIYQIFLPYRSFDLHDIASDCVGIVAALLLFKLITIRRDSQTLSSKQ